MPCVIVIVVNCRAVLFKQMRYRYSRRNKKEYSIDVNKIKHETSMPGNYGTQEDDYPGMVSSM